MATLSPSQVETFDCARRWAFKYIEKGPEVPQTDAMKFGIVAAKLLEDYYEKAVLPISSVHGQVVLEALRHLPKAHPAVKGEAPLFEIPFAGGVFGSRRAGREAKRDVYAQTRADGFRLGKDDTGEYPFVGDLKTSSSFTYMKTPEMLKVDVQATLYAKASMLETGKDAVWARWVYVTRPNKSHPKPKSQTSDVLITKSDVDRAEEKWYDKVEHITQLYAIQPKPNDLPPNTSVCHKFRGCQFASRCNLSPKQRMEALMTTTPNPDTKKEVSNYLAGINFGKKPSPPLVQPPVPPANPTKETAPMTIPAAPAAPKKFGGFGAKPPPKKLGVFDFALPEGVADDQRIAFLAHCFDNDANPLEHLGETPDDEFCAKAEALVNAHKADLAEAQAQAAREAEEAAARAAAPVPTEPDPAPAAEAPAKRGPGRPPLPKADPQVAEATLATLRSLDETMKQIQTFMQTLMAMAQGGK